jgi:hypothetical protein
VLSTSCRAYTSQAFIHVDVNEGNHKAGLPRRCIETGEFEQTVVFGSLYFPSWTTFSFYHVKRRSKVWKWFYTVGLGGYLSVHTEKMIWSKHHVELVIVSETLFLGKENERSRIAVPPVSLCRLSSIAVPLGVSPESTVMLRLCLCLDFERSGCNLREIIFDI